jgi:hypothetical protein
VPAISRRQAVYVIFNLDNGCFVNRPGSKCSFTEKLQYARVFATRELARRNAAQVTKSSRT